MAVRVTHGMWRNGMSGPGATSSSYGIQRGQRSIELKIIHGAPDGCQANGHWRPLDQLDNVVQHVGRIGIAVLQQGGQAVQCLPQLGPMTCLGSRAGFRNLTIILAFTAYQY